MRLPNKLYTFDESTLANFPRILNNLDNPKRLIDLHFDLVKQVGGTAELIEALIESYYEISYIYDNDTYKEEAPINLPLEIVKLQAQLIQQKYKFLDD